MQADPTRCYYMQADHTRCYYMQANPLAKLGTQGYRQIPQEVTTERQTPPPPSEAWQIPHEARQTPHEARQTPHEARQTPHEARQTPQEFTTDPWQDVNKKQCHTTTLPVWMRGRLNYCKFIMAIYPYIGIWIKRKELPETFIVILNWKKKQFRQNKFSVMRVESAPGHASGIGQGEKVWRGTTTTMAGPEKTGSWWGEEKIRWQFPHWTWEKKIEKCLAITIGV